mgnify:CR=1 FL=1|jgi:hypothetical protein
MTPTTLHIFAVNGESDLRHTNLTRAQGLAPDLPPLGEWLGLDALRTDQIEIFPVEDLGDMSLSDYVVMAFDPSAPPDPGTRARLDALEGSVLLVPDTAMPAEPKPGGMLTSIAKLALARADHVADLPKADLQPAAAPDGKAAPEEPPKKRKGLSQGIKVVIFIVIFLALYILLDGG